ncbi:lipase family protein [Neolewinella persica]|uniref:lipase family protein n=1 Tax=Neolewinella persica TaxID=70998 RepID=UPI00037515A4|nr:lipase family protein [Neolewinella persica]
MKSPSPVEIETSMNAVTSGAGLKKKDFMTICRQYLAGDNPSQLVMSLMASNKYLAETVILFGNHLRGAGSDEQESMRIIDQMYRHYVINTQGPIPIYDTDVLATDKDDQFDVFAEATEYAKILSVGVSKAADGTSLLLINGREVPCPSWGVLPGWSPAYSLRKVGPVINKVRYGRDDVIPSSVFGFDENAGRLTLENAMTLADFSHLAYLNPDFIEKQLRQWGYHSFAWIEDGKTDTQSFVVAKDNHIVVCFRGTGSGQDWIVDAKLLKTSSIDGKGRVHRGFKSALDSVWDRIAMTLSTFDDNKKVYFTGHSLGAALAQLAAYRQAISGPNKVGGVYVYGSPRVGNRDYKAAYDGLLQDKTFLHINNTDLVPQVPPRILGYRHLGDTPNRFDIGHVLSNPVESSQEDGLEVERIDQLSPELQASIREDLRAANRSVEASTVFLEVLPQDLQSVSYSTTFETGRVDDHSMDQYLFKFGCAIVDGEFKRLSGGR